MAYTFIFMRNSQTNKPPITLSVAKWLFWSVILTGSVAVILFTYYMYAIKMPEIVNKNYNYLKQQNYTLQQANNALTTKNNNLVIEVNLVNETLEKEQTKVAELQAEANIVEKIKKDSLEQIAQVNQKLADQNSQIVFYQELMSPAVKEELQCFNINAKYGKKYVDYGLNLVLDNKSEVGKKYSVEFRLLSGANNVDLTKTLPEELAPDAIRDISIKNSIRLTGKIKHNNKISGIKVIDVRVFNKNKELVSQCWKVF